MANPDFELSRAGWELYHMRRYPRANYPVSEPERFPDPGPAIADQSSSEPGGQEMQGLNRLANLAKTIMSDIDKEADSAADELVAAKTEAMATVGHFRTHAGAIRKVADDVKAQLGQISNMPPTSGSGS